MIDEIGDVLDTEELEDVVVVERSPKLPGAIFESSEISKLILWV